LKPEEKKMGKRDKLWMMLLIAIGLVFAAMIHYYPQKFEIFLAGAVALSFLTALWCKDSFFRSPSQKQKRT